MSDTFKTEISGQFYRYAYNPETGNTEYVGPVTDEAELARLRQDEQVQKEREEEKHRWEEEANLRHGIGQFEEQLEEKANETYQRLWGARSRDRANAHVESTISKEEIWEAKGQIKEALIKAYQKPEQVPDSELPIHVHIHLGDVVSGDKVGGDKVAGDKVEKKLHDSVNTGGM